MNLNLILIKTLSGVSSKICIVRLARWNKMFDLTGTQWDDDWMWSLKRKNNLLWKEIVINEYIKQNDTNLSKEQLMQWFDMDIR